MFKATLAAPPRRFSRFTTFTIGTGASGEMRVLLFTLHYVHDRYRSFWGDARAFAPEIGINHYIAYNKDAQGIESAEKIS
jgi:hypothetical protein